MLGVMWFRAIIGFRVTVFQTRNPHLYNMSIFPSISLHLYMSFYLLREERSILHLQESPDLADGSARLRIWRLS